MRHDHRKDNEQEQELIALEFELCKSVCYEAAYERLQKRTNKRQHECVEQSREIIVILDDRGVCIKSRMLRHKTYRNVNEVFR